ncbi:hypothetical protein DPSP01_011065 [Paraphaeosphaeria sporulosa]
MTEELHICARFEPNPAINAGCPTFVQTAMDPASFDTDIGLLDMQPIGESVIPGDPIQPLDLSFWDSAFTEPEVAKPQSKTERKAKKKSQVKVQEKLDSESDLESGPVGKRTRSSNPRSHTSNRDSTFYPTLPADATPENYYKDRDDCRADNTRDKFHTSQNRDIRSFSVARRNKIVRARLIAGRYGVEARKPCDSCRALKKSCRIFHPAMYTKASREVNRHWTKRVNESCACCSSGSKLHCNAE